MPNPIQATVLASVAKSTLDSAAPDVERLDNGME